MASSGSRKILSQKTKQMALILAVPMLCLGVGLWMQYRYNLSSVRKALQDAAWRELETGASTFLSQVHQRLDTLPFGATVVDELARLMREYPPAVGDVMVLEGASGRAIATQGRALPEPMVGAVAANAWKADPAPGEVRGGGQRGRLMLPDGVHFGLAYALPQNRGRIVIHKPLADVDRQVTTACAALPMIGLLTFLWVCVLLGIATYLLVARFHDQIDQERNQSTTDSLRQIQNLLRTRDAVIFGLAKLAESRDPETGHHLERISVYSTTLAAELRRHPQYRDAVSPAFVRLIGISSALHDIGKVGVPDSILQKCGPLTDQEREAMSAHAALGGDCLREIQQRLGGSSFLQMARDIAYAHHERWDGRGYPNELKEEQIPLAARIVALADMYDALSSKRVYKEAIPHEECVAIIQREAGKKLEPVMVEIWMGIESRFRSIGKRYANSEESVAPPALTSVAAEQGSDALLEEWQLVTEGSAQV